MRKIDAVGKTYGRLTVMEERGKKRLVGCECGNVKELWRTNVLSGKSLSCGCLRNERTSAANFKHGHSAQRTPTYISWKAMWTRCRNPMRHSVHRYLERGITVDPAWQDFSAFLADMGERPEGTELDRINNDLGYSKENCRWATHQQNCQNKG